MAYDVRNVIKGDKVIWTIFFLLCLISLVEVFSATSTLVYKQGVWGPILKHAMFLGGGAILIVGIQNIKYNKFKSAIPLGLIASLICLFAVFMMQRMTNGAARWLDVGPFQFQPSEMAKGVAVILVAYILSRYNDKKDNMSANDVLKIIGFYILPMLALILPENLSTVVILAVVIFIMLCVGGIPYQKILWIAGFLLLGAMLLATLIFAVPMTSYQRLEEKLPPASAMTHRIETWHNRFLNHHDTEDVSKLDPYGKDAQRTHANIAIATSNILGKVPGNSVERDFLSQAYSDFIYAIIVEELGLVGGVIVVLLYIFLLIRAWMIARVCVRSYEQKFPAYLVIGLTLLIVVQALMNMMVAVGLMPVTGQPLPLISRGGTSILFNCIYIGMILSVSRAVHDKMNNSKKNLKTSLETETEKKS